jgi:hypothetical protein
MSREDFKYLDRGLFINKFNSGESISDLMKFYGVSEVSINNWKRKLGLKNRSRKRPDLRNYNLNRDTHAEKNPAWGYRKLNWLTKGALKRLYKMYGCNYRLLANAIGVNQWTVRKAAIEFGMMSLVSKGQETKRTIFTERIREKSYNTHCFFRWDEEIQNRVRLRDEVCFVCGEDNRGKQLAVHHIFYDLRFSEERCLASLCDVCHAKTRPTKRRGVWIDYFIERLSVKYGYSYSDILQCMIRGGDVPLVENELLVKW